jgi:hypothetical protein
LGRPAHHGACVRLVQELFVNRHVVVGHTGNGEPLLDTLPHKAPVQSQDAIERGNGLFDAVDDAASYVFVDHLGRSPRLGHRLDHGKPERFRPIDRKKQSARLAQESP